MRAARRARARARWLASIGAAAALLVAAPAAWAQSPADKAAAEALFDEAKRDMEAGRHAEAARKLEASQKLDAGVGTLLYLADAYEKSGRVASAWATFREAAYSAKAIGQADREKIARARAAELEPKLYRLKLVPPASEPAGLEIRRNGAPVAKELWGSAVPVDPGSYVIEASAPGKKPWSTTYEVPAGAGAHAIDVPALEAAPAPPAPAPTPAAAAPAAPAPKADEAASDGTTQRVVGGVIAGVGVVGIAVGAIFVGDALSKDAEADEHCEGTRCRDLEGQALSEDARSAADLSTVFFGVGAAALVGGVVLYLAAPSAPHRTSASRWATVTPAVGARSGGLSLRGSF